MKGISSNFYFVAGLLKTDWNDRFQANDHGRVIIFFSCLPVAR